MRLEVLNFDVTIFKAVVQVTILSKMLVLMGSVRGNFFLMATQQLQLSEIHLQCRLLFLLNSALFYFFTRLLFFVLALIRIKLFRDFDVRLGVLDFLPILLVIFCAQMLRTD